MHRYPDWPSRLNQYLNLELNGNKAFKIGRHDCCFFIAGAVKTMTGHNLMKGVDKYHSWDQAKKLLKDKTSLYHMLLRAFGQPTDCAHAHHGDIAYVNNGRGEVPSCGVVLGRRTLFYGPKGFQWVQTLDIDKAFRVPY